MAFLDEIGVAELWSLVKAEDGKNAKIVADNYNGNDVAERFISLGVTPKAVLVVTTDGTMGVLNTGDRSVYGGLALPAFPVKIGSFKALEIVEGGFKVFSATDGEHSALTNSVFHTYNYIALC